MERRRAAGAPAKGGAKVSLDREHMAEIGRRGGAKVSQNREHMATIGKKGGDLITSERLELNRVPASEAGLALEQNAEVVSALNKLFGISSCRTFEPGRPYLTQLEEAMAELPAAPPETGASANAG